MRRLLLVTAFLAAALAIPTSTGASAHKCAANETWNQCSSPCEATCGDPKFKACIERCDPPSCQCSPGFFRNSTGTCVSENDCGQDVDPCANHSCPESEYCVLKEVTCIRAPCNPIPTCVEHPKPSCNTVKCSAGQKCEMKPMPCLVAPCPEHPTCVADLSAGCGENQKVVNCLTLCEKTCSDPERLGIKGCFAKICMPGKCQCTDGFVRNRNGECIKQDVCTAEDKKMNPCAYLTCLGDSACVPTNGTAQCVEPERPAGCAATTCLVGYDCVEDANGAGKCVKPSGQNQGNCSTNEYWDSCGGCESKCGESAVKPCPLICRLEGACRCKQGFFRSVSGQCVTQNDCDVEAATGRPRRHTCGANETWSECGACDQKCGQESMACPAVCRSGACQCKFGFRRDAGGRCVSEEDCGAATGPKITCANIRCAGTCTDTPTGARCSTSTSAPTITCANIRCSTGLCMDTPDGPQCGTNEKGPVTTATCELVDCRSGLNCIMAEKMDGELFPVCVPSNVSTCATTDCVSGQECYMQQVQCFVPPCYPVPTCRNPVQPPLLTCSTMLCRPGYTCVNEPVVCKKAPCPRTRARCVPISTNSTDGPSGNATCGRNEYWNACGGCESNCGEPALKMCNDACLPGACRCSPGFFRNTTGSCVEEAKCGNETESCGPNASWNECGNGCERSCDNRTPMCPLMCAPGACVCDGGFYRNRYGDCVNATDCDLDEEQPITCANMDCAEGFLCEMAEVQCIREPCDPQPTCVASNSTEVCGHNEVRSECKPVCEDTCHGVKTCSGGTSAAVCESGCKCAKNFRRNAKGNCVKNNKCYLNPGCGDNEEWSKCIGCEAKCGQETSKNCSKGCRSGCGCVDGFARDDSGVCVEADSCILPDRK